MAAATTLDAELVIVGGVARRRGGLCKSASGNFGFISATCTWINIHKYPARKQTKVTALEL